MALKNWKMVIMKKLWKQYLMNSFMGIFIFSFLYSFYFFFSLFLFIFFLYSFFAHFHFTHFHVNKFFSSKSISIIFSEMASLSIQSCWTTEDNGNICVTTVNCFLDILREYSLHLNSNEITYLLGEEDMELSRWNGDQFQ